MARYKILSGRLAIGNNIYEANEILDESQIPKNNLDSLLRYKTIKLLDESVIVEKVNKDLNNDGVIDSKDKSIAAKVLNSKAKK